MKPWIIQSRVLNARHVDWLLNTRTSVWFYSEVLSISVSSFGYMLTEW